MPFRINAPACSWQTKNRIPKFATRTIPLVAIILSLTASYRDAQASDIRPPLSERFAQADQSEVPDFQKHVIPLLGRLGCNGRACHGSFQGRGDFQLSLFGYDFKADHQALLEESAGRVDLDDVDESLILVKPTDADQHEGGKRFDKQSWQHHVLRRWIESGATYRDNQVQTLENLVVQPAQILFGSAPESVQLKVVAQWEDGSREDVTELCRFRTNNDAIATVDELGKVESQLPGDTHIVVSYDKAVVPIQVIQPHEGGPTIAESDSSHPIDQIVASKLNKLRIVPSAICSDADFIRRASLDIAGVLPSSRQVREFLANQSPDKREQLIDELLNAPGYAAWWATRFSDWTGNNAEQLNNALPIRNVAGTLWYEWLRTRIEDNMPYDEIVEGIVVATSRQEGESYLDYCENMTQACQKGNEEVYAARDSLPLFWNRRNFQKPDDRAIGFAYTFLGIRIECAQCHKHPFDRWSKNDFDNFAKLFQPIRANPNTVAPDAKQNRQELISAITDGEELKGGELRKSIYAAANEGKVVPFGEILINTRAIKARARKAARKGGKKASMRIPSGKILGELTKLSLENDTRPALMEWLRSPENPYFAKAIVNRVWSNYFGIGIVDPTDDMNLGNPPSNAELLDHLASEFIAQKFDLKWLHRTIVTSDTYQRSAQTNATNVRDQSNFSRHVPRRLPAEVLYDATMLATGSDQQVEPMRQQLKNMAINNAKPRFRNRSDFALTVFGQSIRSANCDCDRSDNPSLLQSIYLRNDRDIHARLSGDQGWVAQACGSIGVAGPQSDISTSKQIDSQKRAETIQDRFVARIDQYKDQPNVRKKKQRAQLKQQYKRVTKKLELLGYQIPSLDQLLKQDQGWGELELLADHATAKKESVHDVVQEAYLRTLSRYPDDEEMRISTEFINESETPAAGIESLMWALINTKEFIISH